MVTFVSSQPSDCMQKSISTTIHDFNSPKLFIYMTSTNDLLPKKARIEVYDCFDCWYWPGLWRKNKFSSKSLNFDLDERRNNSLLSWKWNFTIINIKRLFIFIFSLTFGALLSDYSLLDIISPPIENMSLPFFVFSLISFYSLFISYTCYSVYILV